MYVRSTQDETGDTHMHNFINEIIIPVIKAFDSLKMLHHAFILR